MRYNQGDLGPTIYTIGRTSTIYFDSETRAKFQEGYRYKYNAVPTGFKSVDNFIHGFFRGELAIISGAEAMGKTAFLLSIANRMCIDYKMKVMYFNPINSAKEIGEKLLRIHLEKSREEIEQLCSQNGELEELSKVKDLKELNLLIDDEQFEDPLDLVSRIHYSHDRFKISVFIIDDLEGIGNVSKTKKSVNSFLKVLKKTALELNCVIILASQIRRPHKVRTKYIPVPDDLNRQGNFDTYADFIGFIYRPEYYGCLEDKKGRSNAGIAHLLIYECWNMKKRKIRIKMRFMSEIGKFKDFNPIVYEEQSI